MKKPIEVICFIRFNDNIKIQNSTDIQEGGFWKDLGRKEHIACMKAGKC